MGVARGVRGDRAARRDRRRRVHRRRARPGREAGRSARRRDRGLDARADRARRCARVGAERTFRDGLELIASGDIDVVHICTPERPPPPAGRGGAGERQARRVREAAGGRAWLTHAALCAAVDAAGLVATVPVRLPLLPDGARGPGPARDAGRPGAAHPRQLPAGLAVHRAGRQLARRQQPRRSVTGLRRHRLALVRPRRVRHRRPHRVGVRRADHGAARAPVGGRRAPRVRATGDQRRLRAVGRHRGRRPGHVPHGAGRDGFAGGQPDLLRSQEPAALRDRGGRRDAGLRPGAARRAVGRSARAVAAVGPRRGPPRCRRPRPT